MTRRWLLGCLFGAIPITTLAQPRRLRFVQEESSFIDDDGETQFLDDDAETVFTED